MPELADHPYWELSFDESGHLTSPDARQFTAEVAQAGVGDLFVLAHGWGNSRQAAEQLYQAMCPLIAQAAGMAMPGSTLGFVGVFWPSLWFPDAPPAAVALVAAAGDAGLPGAADTALSGQEIAEALAPSFADPAKRQAVTRLGQLVDEGAAAAGAEPDAAQQARLTEFHQLVGSLLPAGPEPVEDSGETSLLQTLDPRKDYQRISDIMGGGPPAGDAQGLDDVFRKVWNGAKDVLRTLSYYQMKARAGTVGQTGLGPLLEQLGERSTGLRVHLVGHSFGARLVAFALRGTSSAAASPVASLSLIQGAFSHWAFTPQTPFGEPGSLNDVADRVHGPLVATFSEYDWAVGRWYPRASALAQEDVESAETLSRWGGMGADGFQGVEPGTALTLLPEGRPYALTPASFYRVDGAGVIRDISQSSFSGAHSDIEHAEVAWLVVSAAAAAMAPARGAGQI
jgi:hypothetical protein